MQFGVCGDMDVSAAAARAAYDYAEWNVGSLLKPRESEDAFDVMRKRVQCADLSYPVANGFVPGDLKITGSEVDFAALREYVAVTMRRAAAAGVRVIVFGSGGARRIPDGFDGDKANEQIVRFCSMAAGLADEHGVVIAVEPLNRSECNVLNSVSECAGIVQDVGHPALRLLVDAYHLMRENDSLEDIVKYGELLAHVHIATVPNRLPPDGEPCDFAPFFEALAKAGYRGRVSIEGKIPSPEINLKKARKLMAALAGS